jgi:thiol-disulfide isomerase/thioredoxin
MVMVFLAILPLLLNSKLDRHIHSRLENWTSILLAMSGTLMFAFSGYILYTTLFELHENCNFCIGLTILSGSLFTVSLNIGGWQKLRQQLLAMMIVLMLIVVGIFGLYTIATTSRYSTQIYDRITTTSGQKEISLAQHLTKTKAKMYGAFWCGHCHEQKEMFGEAAWNQIDYIECDPKGKNSRSDICKTAKIKGFPTWEINDRLYLGKQSLDKLSELSGYRVADRPLSR